MQRQVRKAKIFTDTLAGVFPNRKRSAGKGPEGKFRPDRNICYEITVYYDRLVNRLPV